MSVGSHYGNVDFKVTGRGRAPRRSKGDILAIESVLVFLNAYRNDPQAHGITVVAFHPEVFRVSYFRRE